jgi:ribosome biogenesis GTPase
MTGHSTKVVAANIDKAAIVQDAKYDFNIRRIERLQSLLFADGIPTILILTKADLLEDIEAYRRRIQTRFPDCPLYTIDNMSGAGAATLLSSLQSNSTLMLVGASGSGKSSLINCLCHTEITKTAGVREKDGRGRHTTTTRHLYQLPNGALLIDTPGSIQNSFDDIAKLATSCKFNNCHHRGEPGCAVQKALHDGSLEQDRYINYLRLTQEAQSWEEIVRQSKEKKKTIGKIRYQNRRSGGR